MNSYVKSQNNNVPSCIQLSNYLLLTSLPNPIRKRQIEVIHPDSRPISYPHYDTEHNPYPHISLRTTLFPLIHHSLLHSTTLSSTFAHPTLLLRTTSLLQSPSRYKPLTTRNLIAPTRT